jgi:hypothetical protein
VVGHNERENELLQPRTDNILLESLSTASNRSDRTFRHLIDPSKFSSHVSAAQLRIGFHARIVIGSLIMDSLKFDFKKSE